MIFGVFTVIITAIIVYAFWREGPLTSFAMCVNILLAGVLAFNFFEPIADELESVFSESFAQGTEDALSLMLIFLPLLMLFRWITNSIAPSHMEYPPVLYRGGAVVAGVLAGYLLSGFLMCVMLTLPMPRDMLMYEPYEPGKSGPLRKVMPPDLVWLAMLQRLSGAGLSTGEDPQTGMPVRFDQHATYELRYGRYRRYITEPDKSGGEREVILPFRGELQP
jgi:hypothetical protein